MGGNRNENEDDFDNYMLNSSRLWAAAMDQAINWDLIDWFLCFVFKILIFVILILVWGILFTKDGIIDAIFCTCLYLFFYWCMLQRSMMVEGYLTLTLFALKYYNKTAFDNTIKEAKKIVPLMKECEKIDDLIERKVEYDKIVAIMDEKYGPGNHLIGPPLIEIKVAIEKEYEEGPIAKAIRELMEKKKIKQKSEEIKIEDDDFEDIDINDFIKI